MKRKERYVARLDEVTIIREGEYAFIEYKEEGIPRTGLQIGPEIAGMSDGEIVELHNEEGSERGQSTIPDKFSPDSLCPFCYPTILVPAQTQTRRIGWTGDAMSFCNPALINRGRTANLPEYPHPG
jgi:hypothetical protein